MKKALPLDSIFVFNLFENIECGSKKTNALNPVTFLFFEVFLFVAADGIQSEVGWLIYYNIVQNIKKKMKRENNDERCL